MWSFWDAWALWQAVSMVCNTTLVQCVRDKLSGAPFPLPRGMPPLQSSHSGSAHASEGRRAEEESTEEDKNQAPLRPSPKCDGPGCTCGESEQKFWSAVGECRGLHEERVRDLGPVCGSSAYFVYAGLLSILPRYPTAAGFLWTNDDLILNYWNLEHCNKVLDLVVCTCNMQHLYRAMQALLLRQSLVQFFHWTAPVISPLQGLWRHQPSELSWRVYEPGELLLSVLTVPCGACIVVSTVSTLAAPP